MLLKQAGFEEFLGLPPRIEGDLALRRLKVKRGRTAEPVEPEVWLGLQDFFLTERRDETPTLADNLYNAFGECISNVKEHAYSDRSVGGTWYAMAIGGWGDQPARAVIADLGVGIPRTVVTDLRTRIMHRTLDLIPIISKLVASREHRDYQCIRFASLGKWKQDRDPKRGTGLAGLRRAVEQADFSAMHVVSGGGQLTVTKSGDSDPGSFPRLKGTIVCLELQPWPDPGSGAL